MRKPNISSSKIPNQFTEPIDQQRLVCWLEDTHIRRYQIDERQYLRKPGYNDVLKTYLKSLQAPENAYISPTASLNWLVDTALSFSYADEVNQDEDTCMVHDPWYGRAIPTVRGMSTDTEVRQQISMMLKHLGETRNFPDSTTGAKTAAAMVEHLIMQGNNGEGMKMRIEDTPLGFDTGDPLVNSFAKVVRILNVRELRDAQDRVNEAITDMQKVTARPSTDASLGKVGR